jgi:hypothetical protein
MSHPIKAANIEGVDLEAISALNPESANKIALIVTKMNKGQDTDEEFIELCCLLEQFGYSNIAKELLIANTTGHGLQFDLLTQKYPHITKDFQYALSRFETQFGVSLTLTKSIRAFSGIFRFRVLSLPGILGFAKQGDKGEVHITYHASGETFADVFVNRTRVSFPLKFEDGDWTRDE